MTIIVDSIEIEVYWDFAEIENALWSREALTVLELSSCAETKESQYFRLKCKNNHSGIENIGYLLPIQTLFSEILNSDNNSKSLKNYAVFAVVILCKYNPNLLKKIEDNYVINLNLLEEEYQDPNTCFAIFHNPTMEKMNLKIDNLIASFYTNGFLYSRGLTRDINDFEKAYFSKKLQDKKKLTLLPLDEIQANSEFIKNLFLKDLLINDNQLIRFFLSYQIIEYYFNIARYHYIYSFIATRNEDWLKSEFENSSNFSKIFKNSFHSDNESELIGKVLSSVKFNNFNEGIDEDLIKILGSEMTYLKKTDNESLIYPLRNKIVHNLRNVDYNSKEVKRVCFWFEINVIEALVQNKFQININELQK
jgi:hypothetical protein